MSEYCPGLEGIMDLRFRNTEDALRCITKTLREGTGDELFFQLLADQIDPDKLRTITKTKLVVKRTGGKGGTPRAKTNTDLQLFLELHIDVFEEKTEMVFVSAKEKFGCSRSTSAKVLQEGRILRKNDPELWEWFKNTAFKLQELGDPQFQRL